MYLVLKYSPVLQFDSREQRQNVLRVVAIRRQFSDFNIYSRKIVSLKHVTLFQTSWGTFALRRQKLVLLEKINHCENYYIPVLTEFSKAKIHCHKTLITGIHKIQKIVIAKTVFPTHGVKAKTLKWVSSFLGLRT